MRKETSTWAMMISIAGLMLGIASSANAEEAALTAARAELDEVGAAIPSLAPGDVPAANRLLVKIKSAQDRLLKECKDRKDPEWRVQAQRSDDLDKAVRALAAKPAAVPAEADALTTQAKTVLDEVEKALKTLAPGDPVASQDLISRINQASDLLRQSSPGARQHAEWRTAAERVKTLGQAVEARHREAPAQPAAAAGPAGQPAGGGLQPPPPTSSYKSRPLHSDLVRMHLALTQSCILAESDTGAMARLGEKVSSFKAEPADQPRFAAYYNDVLLPAYNAAKTGVLGFGTYEEIDARRAASMKALAELLPKGPVSDETQAQAFITAYRAYEERAAADFDYLSRLQQTSGCHAGTAPLEKLPHLGGFSAWRRAVEPRNVVATLHELRDEAAPGGGPSDRVEKLVAKLSGAVPTTPQEGAAGRKQRDQAALPTDIKKLGQLARDAVMLYHQVKQANTNPRLLELWAGLYDGAEREALLSAPARAEQSLDALVTGAIKVLGQIEPPAATVKDKKLLTIANPLVKKRRGPALSVRVLSPMEKVDREETDTEDLGDRVVVHKYRVVYDTFAIGFVGDDRPYAWWPDLPGLPAKQVCTAMTGMARRYKKGRNVPLNKWLFVTDDIAIPILCRNKDKAGAPR